MGIIKYNLAKVPYTKLQRVCGGYVGCMEESVYGIRCNRLHYS